MNGPGTQVFAGSNTYSGGTNVNGGILQAKTPGSLPGYNAPNTVSVARGASWRSMSAAAASGTRPPTTTSGPC